MDDVAAKKKGGRARRGTKGRALDDAALADIRALLPDDLRRDLLIEYLHVIQDRFGALFHRHLHALAERMRIAQAEVFEVASFYHHFDILPDDAVAPAVTIRICDSVSCRLAGAESLIAATQAAIDPGQVRVIRAPCIGRCDTAPAASVGQNAVGWATAPRLAALAGQRLTAPVIPDAVTLAAYRATGGYDLLAQCRAGARPVDTVIADITASGLRGLGGAGFPAGRKWQIVRGFPGPRLMTVNADEGEPGTFKDRFHLERDPHRMLEGALIAAWAVGAERIVIYLRDEYAGLRTLLAREIADLVASRLNGSIAIELRRGAGAYICGEESAMLESIEGKRGLPRHRPPYIAEHGLFGRPTLNHNVETLVWVRAILERGADWFAGLGQRGAKGLRSFSVSGRVRHPGVKLAPAGITVRELIADYCGGMLAGHRLAAYLPGGASGGLLPASLADEPLDFGTLERHGCFVGSHAVVVLSDQDDVRDVARNLMDFFAHESCGQCTPCRLGTVKMGQLMQAEVWDEALIGDLEQVMRDASICGLGQAAPNPVRSVLRFFEVRKA
jgi:formate dehydrogenase beta subunit